MEIRFVIYPNGQIKRETHRQRRLDNLTAAARPRITSRWCLLARAASDPTYFADVQSPVKK